MVSLMNGRLVVVGLGQHRAPCQHIAVTLRQGQVIMKSLPVVSRESG